MNWSWPWGRGPQPVRLPGCHVRVYTRRGCHLCEAAWQLLREQQDRYGFVLDAVDVDAAPALAARYGDSVPVVLVNGRERFRGRVNPVLLGRLLRGEAGRANG